MSEAEHPDRRAAGEQVTVEQVRSLVGAATPHFALQVRNRVARLIADLAPEHPARVEGERQMVRLADLGAQGETRGTQAEPGMATLRSVDPPRA